MKSNSTSIIAGAMALALMALPALADNPNYAPGDLVLFFQKPNVNTVYVSLGNAATVFRGTATGPDVNQNDLIINVNSTLNSAFGTNWKTDPDIYAGLATVYDSDPNLTTLTNGDPPRTLYVSVARTGVGTVGQPESNTWDLSLAGNTAMTGASNGIVAMNTVFDVNSTTNPAILSLVNSQIDEQNPFLQPGVQGNAFNGNLEGGIQQKANGGNFGYFTEIATNVVFALDLYRVQARNNVAGQVGFGQPNRVGTFEGIVTVATGGRVSYLSKGAVVATPYDTWIDTFTTITQSADKLPTADYDKDGLTNLMEFVLNGNPAVSNTTIAPTLNASGADYVFSFNRRDDSETNTNLQFQYGTDLNVATWTSVTIGVTGSVSGNATISVMENSTNPDAISVTIPKSAFPGGKLFGRLKAVR